MGDVTFRRYKDILCHDHNILTCSVHRSVFRGGHCAKAFTSHF